MFQSEAEIDYACDQDRVLREHFPQVARSHWKEMLPLELEEELLGPDGAEDDETETARSNTACSAGVALFNV